MEHSLHVTHIKIKRSQLYLTIQLPRPDMKIQAELFYQNSSQNFRHQLRCVSRNPQNLIFQIDVSVLKTTGTCGCIQTTVQTPGCLLLAAVFACSLFSAATL